VFRTNRSRITPSTFATPVESGDLVDGPYFSQALLLIPRVAATLAATGTTSSLWLLLGGGAVGLLAAGLLLARVRRLA